MHQVVSMDPVYVAEVGVMVDVSSREMIAV